MNQNVLDVVYQTVTRTAIRVHDDNRDCKFFVPDMRAANWLANRLPNAVIDDTQAITLKDKNGGQVGNKGNTSQRGCSVIRALVEKYATKPKAKRLVDKFEKANGFYPNIDEPKHMLRLFKANAMKRVPKDFNFDISVKA
ncbi:hypothetical protein A152_0021835 [Vibrio tasmaniensis 1F-187]|uniref:hypothetical protein n=1 Tax=unclassified Vibrio TaxID=2614977 RepID=UPI001112C8FA|nr:hypothetical protein [Vibrio tasmaniensis]